jgi:hypothetical protein
MNHIFLMIGYFYLYQDLPFLVMEHNSLSLSIILIFLVIFRQFFSTLKSINPHDSLMRTFFTETM